MCLLFVVWPTLISFSTVLDDLALSDPPHTGRVHPPAESHKAEIVIILIHELSYYPELIIITINGFLADRFSLYETKQRVLKANILV